MSIGNIYNALSRLDDSIAADPEQLKNDVLPIMQKNLSNYLQSNPTNSINKIVDESGNTMLHRAILEKKIYLAQLLINHGAKNIENNSGLTPKILAENAALKGRIIWEKSPPASSEKPGFSFSSPFSASSSPSSSSSSKKNESTNNLKSFLDSLSGKGSSVNDSTKSKPTPQPSSFSSKPSSAASSKADENFGKYFGQSPYGFGAPEKESTKSKSKPAPQSSSSSSKPFVSTSADDIFAKFFGQNPFGFDEPAKDESESKMETEESQSAAKKPSPSDERSKYLPTFREALEKGNIEKAISIKNQCRSIILAEFENGQTALHIAATNSQVKMMEWLKHNGVDSTKKDVIGQTAVHKAAINGRKDAFLAVRFLIKRGHRHDDIDNAHCAPLHYVAKAGNLLLVKLLTFNFPNRPGLNANGLSPLDLAAEKGHVAIVHYFLKHNIYKGNSFYSTKAIQLAAKNGHFGVVNMLLRFDRSSVEYFVKSSEYKEVCVKFPEEIAKLLNSGSPEDSMTFDYPTMQWLIANKESDQLITYIKERLKAGAYIDQADMEGYTCLQRAAKDDNLQLVEFLVEYGNAEINDLSCAEGEHGYSPLHFAAKNGNDGMVQYLIWMGAAKEIKASNMVTTPAHLTSDNVIRVMLSKNRKSLSDERECAFSV